jgi:mRNA-binding protein PUF3
MPPSRASDAGLSQNGLSFVNGNPPFNSISHTPRSSIHSQRASFSGLPGSFSAQTNGSRFIDTSQAEAEMREKFSGLSFSTDGEPQSSNYSPGPPAYTQTYQPNGLWNDAGNTKPPQHFDSHSSHAFADQPYLGKGHRFADRGSVSPAGSEHHRGLNSPKYYSAAATPPTGSEQIYRPGSRGPRAPPGPSELDRRLQSLHFAQYMYNAPFQAQFPPQTYDYAQQNFRQGAVPYGFAMPIPPYGQAQPIPTRPAKDHDVGVGVRSVLLEEFRSNSKSNKRYELKVCMQAPWS